MLSYIGLFILCLIIAPIFSFIGARMGIFMTVVNVMSTMAVGGIIFNIISFNIAGIITFILLYLYSFFVWRAQRGL